MAGTPKMPRTMVSTTSSAGTQPANGSETIACVIAKNTPLSARARANAKPTAKTIRSFSMVPDCDNAPIASTAGLPICLPPPRQVVMQAMTSGAINGTA